MMEKNSSQFTILIIDDTPTNLEVLYQSLDQFGYDVLVEMDGHSGIEQAQINSPDLILLDVMMPEIDGFETCCQLKNNPKTQDIPIIFMTALSDTVDKVKGLQLGAVDYITKPFHREELWARIQVHLRLRQVTLELENTLAELKETQLQLIQSEKMSSLGQLVAGVAHEINNPISFIAGNINYLDNYAQDLLNITQFCQQKYSEDPEISEMIEDADLDFMLKDLPRLMSSMKMGTSRISEIVTSLRNFSRLDEAAIKHADIHEGIESTLLILKNRLNATIHRPEIKVIKSYGNLPFIECHAAEVNQVIMNILSNAIDALNEKAEQQFSHESNLNNPTEYQIEVQTTAINSDWISINIKDNGNGICEAVKSKIFDLFFTTKPIGQGMGLGLSISYNIIADKHNGRLICLTELGKGTEFRIEIPVQSQVINLNNRLVEKKINEIPEPIIQ